MKITAVQNKNPKTLGRLALCLLILGFSFSELASAATISYSGTQSNSVGNGFAVANWSNSAVPKDFDLGGDKYGTAGYYQIRPMPWDPGAASIGQAGVSENLLGTDAISNPTLNSQPSFVSSITGGAGTFVNYGGYGIFRGPDGSALYRQGGLSVSVNQGPHNSPAGDGASYFGQVLQFTLGSTANFRIGLAVDSVGTGAYAPNYVGIYNSNTGTVFSAPLTCDGTPDMVFFDISGTAGDSFTVALWQNAATQSPDRVAALSLIAFDIKQPSDMTPPDITLYGSDSVTVPWGGNYTDEGATATDDVDSFVAVIPSGVVNTSKPGVYTITFDATDAAGNAATQVVRTVTVSAPSSTTGGDGLSELMRYALGGNAPGDSVAKTSSSVAGEYLVITAIVRTDDPNLTVVGEAVTDLDYYTTGNSVVEVPGVDADDQDGVPVGCKLRTFSVEQGSDAKKFLRLKASLAQ
jgi:hypothetical protein